MTSTAAPGAPTGYVCRYCRLPSDPSGTSCPNCGAPVDVRAVTSDSGWQEQPPIPDLARLQLGASALQIEGTTVPTADFSLADGDWVFFSHHVLCWMDPAVTLEAQSRAGAWNRSLAGMPLVMMQATGPGHVALSENSPGEVLAIPLRPGAQVIVREHRFLAGTSNVAYDWDPSPVWYVTGSGDDRETHYPLGYALDRFASPGGPALLLLHAPGNTFTRDLGPGETILIHPGSFVWADASIQPSLHVEYPGMSGVTWFGRYAHRTLWLRLAGPGRVAVTSVFERVEDDLAPMTNASYRTEWSW